MDIFQNQRVVDLSDLPARPSTIPDPASCKTFSEWLRELTGTYGVKQKTVAEVAGKTPQAVTKWLNGGMVEAGPLANIAEWTGVSYMDLRRLLDESKIGVLPGAIAENSGKYAVSSSSHVPAELAKAWAKLGPASRRQVMSLAKHLANNGKKSR